MNACFNTEFYLFMHVTQNIQFFVKRFETHTGCEDVGAAFFLNLVTRLKKHQRSICIQLPKRLSLSHFNFVIRNLHGFQT
jgi:hypothetical protein